MTDLDATQEGVIRETIERSRNRLLVTGGLFAVALLCISFRLVGLAATPGSDRSAAAPIRPVHLKMARADIVDRNGVLLATNLNTASLYADPKFVLDPDASAARLVAVLPSLDQAEVAEKLKSKRRFVWLQRNLTPSQQYDVNRLGLPGIDFEREQRRVYPHGRLTAHIVGFTGVDNDGLSGIEKRLDEDLVRRADPLQLSLDIRLQHVVREEIVDAVSRYRALAGTGLVLDVASGEMLAMVSLPDFDANSPASASEDARFNRSSLGTYEMGSTFKIFTLAMGLDTNTVTLRDGYDATKPIRVSRFTIRDFHAKRRWLSVPEIFMYSSNIGAVKMALDVGLERQRDYLGRLGLLHASTIELPEVGKPLVPSPWRQINSMTIAFGHGLAVSPVQMASAVSAVVNGGIIYPATLLKRPADEPSPGRKILRPETSDSMRRLLHQVVEGGTGRRAAAEGYLVGGKTGTAEKSGGRGYQSKALLSSFVGVFPINDPQYVVLVVLDEPVGNEETHGRATGGWVAAPTVGSIITRIAPFLGVEPVDESAPEIRRALLVDTKAEGTGIAAN